MNPADQSWLDRLASGEVELDDPELRIAAKEDPMLAEELAHLDRVATALNEDADEARLAVEEAREERGTDLEEHVRQVFLRESAAGDGLAMPVSTGPKAWIPWGLVAAFAASLLAVLWVRRPQPEPRLVTPLGGAIQAVVPAEGVERIGQEIRRFEFRHLVEPDAKRKYVFVVYDDRSNELARSEDDDGDPTDTLWEPTAPLPSGVSSWQVLVYDELGGQELSSSPVFSAPVRSQ